MPHTAYAFCVAPPTTLFYADNQYSKSSSIHRLDCSGSKPTLCQSIGVCNNYASSFCYLKYHEEELLVVIDRTEIKAFTLCNAEVKWSKKKFHLPDQNKICKPIRIAVGGQGLLFVFDVNNRCIQMFSEADGQYLGCLIKEGQQGLGKIGPMCFCESTSQLIVSHEKDKKTFISVLNVE